MTVEITITNPTDVDLAVSLYSVATTTVGTPLVDASALFVDTSNTLMKETFHLKQYDELAEQDWSDDVPEENKEDPPSIVDRVQNKVVVAVPLVGVDAAALQKTRTVVFALGVQIQGDEDRATLLQKEKDYTAARQKIEISLESFYRSASSLVFQLNKRHVTRHMSIFRCIDRRFETGEIFIKWDEAIDEEWLLLIYIKNNSPSEGIVIEDKSNPEKNYSHDFKSNEIFKASDLMVDSLTQLISRKRAKKTN